MTDNDQPSDAARITIQSFRGVLIASPQVDLDERVLRQFQTDLLERIRASNAHDVVIDLSGVDVLDGRDFEEIRRAIGMAALMGTETVLCGLRPGVAAALVELDVPLDGIRTTLSLDAALADVAAAHAPAQPDDASDEHPEEEGPDDAGGDKTTDRD